MLSWKKDKDCKVKDGDCFIALAEINLLRYNVILKKCNVIKREHSVQHKTLVQINFNI